MKIFVTGATGLLGMHVCNHFSMQGHNVSVLGRDSILGAQLKEMGVYFVAGELEDAVLMQKLITDADVVIHCGGLSKDWGKYDDFYAANVIGTQNIVNACLKYNVNKLIHISSSSVYFAYCNRLNIKEDSPLPVKPANSYVATKLIAEQIVMDGIATGLNAIILRPRGIFGPFDRSIFPKIIAMAQNTIFPLLNNGETLIDLTYVDNVVKAIECAIHAPSKYNGETYNISNGEPTKINTIIKTLFASIRLQPKFKSVPNQVALQLANLYEIVNKIKWWSNTPPKFTRFAIAQFIFDQTLDIQKARTELGFNPEISIKAGIHSYGKWWLANGKN